MIPPRFHLIAAAMRFEEGIDRINAIYRGASKVPHTKMDLLVESVLFGAFIPYSSSNSYARNEQLMSVKEVTCRSLDLAVGAQSIKVDALIIRFLCVKSSLVGQPHVHST